MAVIGSARQLIASPQAYGSMPAFARAVAKARDPVSTSPAWFKAVQSR